MKTICFASLALLFFLMNGCRQKEVEPAFYVYATVGSESFRFEENTYLASSSGAYKSTFILAAFPNSSSQLMFTTTSPLTSAPATLRISFATYYNGPTKSYTGSSGSCIITKFDGKTVEGTFSFDAINSSRTETVQVKDGRFRLKYT